MQQKKSINFGTKGWLLIIFQAIAFLAFTAFTNYPMNLLASSGFFGGWTGDPSIGDITGTALVSTVYTSSSIVAIAVPSFFSCYLKPVITAIISHNVPAPAKILLANLSA